jgi:hypothetical protein
MSSYAFTSYTTDISHTEQQISIKGLAAMLGLDTTSGSKDIEWRQNEVAESLPGLLKRMQPGDTLLIASLAALSETPSQIMDFVHQILGKGLRLKIAEFGGQSVNLDMLQAVIGPALKLEGQVSDLQRQLKKQDQDHKAEFETAQVEYQDYILSMLSARGISFGQLLRPDKTEVAEPARPDLGRELKVMREGLGISQEEAGKLVTPALGKGVVSKIESLGSAAPHYEQLRKALNDADRQRIVARERAKQREQKIAEASGQRSVRAEADLNSAIIEAEERQALDQAKFDLNTQLSMQRIGAA